MIEIERKFLVKSYAWQECVTYAHAIIQGYLSFSPTVRIRLIDDKAVVTVKGPTTGISRAEYEYEIPPRDATEMLNLCHKPLIKKLRHVVPGRDGTWEIDVFEDENAGLVVAEIELGSEDVEFARPEWLGEEVSHDKRYSNASLTRQPFTTW